jgi:hypothetical protein
MNRREWDRTHDLHWEHVRADGGGPDAPALGIVGALEGIDHTLLRMVHVLERIERHLRPRATLGLTVRATPKEVHPMSVPPFSTDSNNDLQLVATPADAAGNPVADVLTWASSDTGVVVLSPAADTLSALGTILKPGSVTVTVSDAAGKSNDVAVSIAAGGAVTIGLAVSAVPKP